MKVLIISPVALTDVIFSTPLIRALKIQLDDPEIHLLTSSEGVYVLEGNPYIDQLREFNHSLSDILMFLRKNHFDLVVDLSNNPSSFLATFLTKAKVLRVKKYKWEEWLMVTLKINQLPNVHITDKFVEVAQALGIKNDGLSLDYFIPEKDEVPIEWLPLEFRKSYVVLCLQTSYATRRLPEQRLIELCDKINKPIILLGADSDVSLGDSISHFFKRTSSSLEWEEGLKELNKKTIVYNACGKFSLHQMASVIKKARCVFTFDNEFIPIASAFKKEIFSLWGNTILDFGRYPYNTKFTVLENTNLPCRPCSTKGFDRCPKGHFKCMNQIVFDFYVG